VRSGGTPERGAAHPEKKSSHPNQPALWGPGWGTGAKRQVGESTSRWATIGSLGQSGTA